MKLCSLKICIYDDRGVTHLQGRGPACQQKIYSDYLSYKHTFSFIIGVG